MCPFSGIRYRSRSFTSFTLRSGLNWSQFLGLGEITPSAQSRMQPQDDGSGWTVELPEVRPNTLQLPPPVQSAVLSIEGRSVGADLVPSDGRELCEYFPRLKRRKHRANPDPVDSR